MDIDFKPECPLGVNLDELDDFFGRHPEYLGGDPDAFTKWFRGQTGSICQGHKYNYETKQEEPDICASNPHGLVIYVHDLKRFINKLPVID